MSDADIELVEEIEALAEKKTAEAADLVAAMQRGVDAAYKAVMKPTEGTMLTVARVSAEQAAADGETDIRKMWAALVANARTALDETPEQLEVLKRPAWWMPAAWAFAISWRGCRPWWTAAPL